MIEAGAMYRVEKDQETTSLPRGLDLPCELWGQFLLRRDDDRWVLQPVGRMPYCFDFDTQELKLEQPLSSPVFCDCGQRKLPEDKLCHDCRAQEALG